jgi:hypothetical protein
VENGEREEGCAVEERVIWLVERFGLVGEFKHPRSLPLQPSWCIKYIWRGERGAMRGLEEGGAMRGLVERGAMRGVEVSEGVEDSGVQGACPFSHHRVYICKDREREARCAVCRREARCADWWGVAQCAVLEVRNG